MIGLMKNMALLIDTNIILDWMLGRMPFAVNSEKVLNHCIHGKYSGCLAVHTLINVFYITRRDFSVAERKTMLIDLCKNFTIVGIDEKMLMTALLNGDWEDLEDGLQIQSAYDSNVDYIITRDPKGFESSNIQVLSPDDFLELTQSNGS